MRPAYTVLSVCLAVWPLSAMNVPGSTGGSTCGFGNNCALWPGNDFSEPLTVAVSGTYKFRLNGSSFAVELAIGSAPCTNNIAVADGVCLGQKSVTCVFLNAGTYYATLDCGLAACCGDWQLTAELCSPEAGETSGSPIIIGALPYLTNNSTDCNANDLDNSGCVSGNSGPDLFYRYTPAANTAINISLSEQGAPPYYRTLIVDGVCHTGSGSSVSVSNYAVTAGIPVNIAVDGCCGQSVDYELQVWDISPFCVVGCDFYFQEPEVCGPEYTDTYNCGCDGTTPVFNVWTGWDGICGKSGTYVLNGASRGESDWYEFVFASPVHTSFSFRGEFPLHARWWRRGPNGCADRVLVSERLVSPCVNGFLADNNLPAGTYWMEVRPQVVTGVPCTARYIFTVFTQPAPAVAPSRLVVIQNQLDIVLYWNSTGAVNYHVYRSQSEPVSTIPANLVATVSDTSYVDPGIVGTEPQLYYVVTAQN